MSLHEYKLELDRRLCYLILMLVVKSVEKLKMYINVLHVY